MLFMPSDRDTTQAKMLHLYKDITSLENIKKGLFKFAFFFSFSSSLFLLFQTYFKISKVAGLCLVPCPLCWPCARPKSINLIVY